LKVWSYVIPTSEGNWAESCYSISSKTQLAFLRKNEECLELIANYWTWMPFTTFSSIYVLRGLVLKMVIILLHGWARKIVLNWKFSCVKEINLIEAQFFANHNQDFWNITWCCWLSLKKPFKVSDLKQRSKKSSWRHNFTWRTFTHCTSLLGKVKCQSKWIIFVDQDAHHYVVQ